MTNLTESEIEQLRAHETTIREGEETFFRVGVALAAIRDGRLYRDKYGSFIEYCEKELGCSDRRARQLMDGVKVVQNITAQLGTNVPLPQSEAQARELSKVLPEKQGEVWKEAILDKGNTQPTARTIARVAVKHLEPTQLASKGLKRLNQQRELDTITNHICKYEEAFPTVESYELLLADLESHAERIKAHLATLHSPAQKAA